MAPKRYHEPGFYNKQNPGEVKGWIIDAVQYTVEEQRAAIGFHEAKLYEQIKRRAAA